MSKKHFFFFLILFSLFPNLYSQIETSNVPSYTELELVGKKYDVLSSSLHKVVGEDRYKLIFVDYFPGMMMKFSGFDDEPSLVGEGYTYCEIWFNATNEEIEYLHEYITKLFEYYKNVKDSNRTIMKLGGTEIFISGNYIQDRGQQIFSLNMKMEGQGCTTKFSSRREVNFLFNRYNRNP